MLLMLAFGVREATHLISVSGIFRWLYFIVIHIPRHLRKGQIHRLLRRKLVWVTANWLPHSGHACTQCQPSKRNVRNFLVELGKIPKRNARGFTTHKRHQSQAKKHKLLQLFKILANGGGAFRGFEISFAGWLFTNRHATTNCFEMIEMIEQCRIDHESLADETTGRLVLEYKLLVVAISPFLFGMACTDLHGELCMPEWLQYWPSTCLFHAQLLSWQRRELLFYHWR